MGPHHTASALGASVLSQARGPAALQLPSAALEEQGHSGHSGLGVFLFVVCAVTGTRGSAEEGTAGWASGPPTQQSSEILKQAGLASWCLGEQVTNSACMRRGLTSDVMCLYN